MKRGAVAILVALTACRLAGRGLAEQLDVADIQRILAQAASKALELTANPIHTNAVIAVSDREGYIVGTWTVDPQFATNPKFLPFLRNAMSRAGTAAFLSSSQHAFSTRTAGFIVQQHFPPGIENTPPGPLVGVNFSNLGSSDINRFKDPAGFNPAVTNGINGGVLPGVITGGLTGAAGGVPLYKKGQLVGGVGVAGDEEFGAPLGTQKILVGTNSVAEASLIRDSFLYELAISPELSRAPDVDEEVALAGQIGFAPDPKLWGSRVFVGGIALAYIANPPAPAATVLPLNSTGVPIPQFPVKTPPLVTYPPLTLGGVTGELRNPIQDDPMLHDASPANDTLSGQPRLTASEVRSILDLGARRARTTRAGIRLPRGRQMQCFIAVVGNPDHDEVTPPVLGVFCTSPDATRFSWDVAVQKARTAVFFSDDTRAFSSRTVGFLAQRFFPPGIQDTTPGIFTGLQEQFSGFPYEVQNPLNAVILAVPVGQPVLSQTPVPMNLNLPNGITIFPGGFPLYRNGVLIGAVGVSGDGIDQDDLVAASAARDFPAPRAIRADRLTYRGARLPFAKFPRNPAL